MRASRPQVIVLSLNRPTGNFWVDTGLVVLINQFGEGEHSVQAVLEWLQSKLLQPTGNKGEYYDQESGQLREYDKVNWVLPNKSLHQSRWLGTKEGNGWQRLLDTATKV